MKVTLTDFQILKDTNTFEFPVGITAIVGQNASGKSSTFYAIKNALTNPNGVADCINHDSTKTSVTIENNNESVTWVKTQTSSAYRNNHTGEEFLKASKLDSRDIADLGFYFDNKDRVLNIHDEWSVLFPFGESDTDMFRLFEDIFNISCSFQVIDEMKKDEQLVKSDIQTCQQEVDTLKHRHAILSGIKDAVKVEVLDNYINTLNHLEVKTSELRKDCDTLLQNKHFSQILLPNVYDVSAFYEITYKLEALRADHKMYLDIKNKCDIDIPKTRLEFNTTPPTELRSNFSSYVNLVNQIKEVELELEELKLCKEQIEIKMSKINVCPTCGRPLEN